MFGYPVLLAADEAARRSLHSPSRPNDTMCDKKDHAKNPPAKDQQIKDALPPKVLRR